MEFLLLFKGNSPLELMMDIQCSLEDNDGDPNLELLVVGGLEYPEKINFSVSVIAGVESKIPAAVVSGLILGVATKYKIRADSIQLLIRDNEEKFWDICSALQIAEIEDHGRRDEKT